MKDNIFIHLLTKHTNLQKPYSDFVKYNKYPEQLTDLVNTEVTIKYRYNAISDTDTISRASVIEKDGKIISLRPHDDDQLLKEKEISDIDIYDNSFVQEDTFTVLRADAVEPYVFIAISKDAFEIIVSSTKIDENGEYQFNKYPSIYPLQDNRFIGLGCYQYYDGYIPEIISTPLRVDSTEPCYTVFAEFIGNDTLRFTLGDEVISKVYGYFEEDDLYKVDIIDRKSSLDFNNIIMTDSEVSDFRKSILKGMRIYGAL